MIYNRAIEPFLLKYETNIDKGLQSVTSQAKTVAGQVKDGLGEDLQRVAAKAVVTAMANKQS